MAAEYMYPHNDSHFVVSGHTMLNGVAKNNMGSQTARLPHSRYQNAYLMRSRGTMRPPGSARIPRRPCPPQTQSNQRAQTPAHVMRAIPGYAGVTPARKFLAGCTTFKGECEVLDYEGQQYQTMRPTDVPRVPDDRRFLKDQTVPGYAGYVSQQIFGAGNPRVPYHSGQYKGEIQRKPLLKAGDSTHWGLNSRRFPQRPMTSR